jgi:diaminohydroxyphosphoribosylaminopyrimidine deaminase/5-amino-6-(5-phosphoribosylamino)uracil reductase
MTPEDRAHFDRALALAARAGRGAAPNPRVGCVVVREGAIVGEGWHRRPGDPHAEIVALEEAGEGARGATLYVTLEPCSHLGRTPPCSEAILEAGVARVVIGLIDPDAQVRGRGVAALEAGGVRVEMAEGDAAAAAREELEDYLAHRERQRTFVVAKSAATLDGRIADREGRSQWITGQAAREHGRSLRDRYGAILVGAGTARTDDPVLLPPTGGECGPFLRCVIDPHLTLPPSARLLSEGPWSPVLVYGRGDADVSRRIALEQVGAQVVALPTEHPSGRLDPLEVARDLARRGVLGAILEGGGRTVGWFLEAGLVDKWYWYLTPSLLADPEARAAVHGPARGLGDAWRGRIAGVRLLGEDMLLKLYPDPNSTGS